MINVKTRRVGHHFRIGAGDLDGYRIHLAFVVGTAAGFLAAPQQGVGRNHFRYRQAGPEFLAQLTERTIGDSGHRGNEQVVA